MVSTQLESILKNEMHTILWDFLIQPDHLIPNWRSDMVYKKKKTYQIMNFANLAKYRMEIKENDKRDKFLDLARGGDGDTNGNGCTRNDPQKLGKENEWSEYQWTSRCYSNYSNVEVSQKAQRSPGYFMRLAVTQPHLKAMSYRYCEKLLRSKLIIEITCRIMAKIIN